MPAKSKITPEKLDKIRELASKGMSLRGIAIRVGLANQYLSRALREGEGSNSKSLRSVYQALVEGYSLCEEKCLDIIWSAAQGVRLEGSNKTPQWTAAARILEALGVWKERGEQEPIERKQITIQIKEIPMREIEDNGE